MSAYQAPGVYIKELDLGPRPIEGVGTSVAAFIGFAEKGPINKPTYVTNKTQFNKIFCGKSQPFYLEYAVNGYFDEGGGVCFIVRLPVGDTKALPVVLPSRESANPTLHVTTKEPGVAFGVEVILPNPPSSTGDKPDSNAAQADDTFTLIVKVGTVEETFKDLTFSTAQGKRNVERIVNDESDFVKVEDQNHPGSLLNKIPAAGTYSTEVPDLAEAIKKTKNLKAHFIGDASKHTGLNGLETVDEVSTVCIPDLMKAYELGALTGDDVIAVQKAMLAHCAKMKYRFAILDPLPGLYTEEVKEWKEKAGLADKFGALYYPWIEVSDLTGSGNTRVPPSGYVAGIYARSDFNRGVHKAPANEVIGQAINPDWPLTKGDVELLNPVGINCIRTFPGRGTRVWGARTLTGDPLWKYVNVRRLFNYIEQSIEQGTQWVVFEPNDLELWGRVRRDITAFLTGLWRAGALFGATPAQAFFVKCDEEINTEDVRNNGQLIIQVGLAPVKPAEFVIFEISQQTSGTTVSE